ncbi:MAG: hypothetical protein R3B45_13930 [Bdellovibrionota bacterium]
MMRKRGSLSSTPALSKLRKPAANIQPSTGMKAHRSMAQNQNQQYKISITNSNSSDIHCVDIYGCKALLSE